MDATLIVIDSDAELARARAFVDRARMLSFFSSSHPTNKTELNHVFSDRADSRPQ